MAKKTAPTNLVKPSLWTRATLPRVILVAGPESTLRNEALAAIKKAAFADGHTDGWTQFYGPLTPGEAEAATPASVLDEVCTRSMFAADDELKVVVIRSADLLIEKHYKLFEEHFDTIPDTAVLVLELTNFGKIKATGFYKKLMAQNAVVECNSLMGDFGETAELEQEIDKRARAMGLKLSHGALVALIARSAKSIGVIEEELAKVTLALRPGTAQPEGASVDVSEHDILELCAATGTATPFDFVNALLDGNERKALETLGMLFERGISDAKRPGKVITREDAIVMVVLGALTYKLSLLQDLRAALDSGKNEFTVFGEFKLFGKRKDDMQSALRRHTGYSLRRCVDALFNTFLDMRRGGGADPRALMERFVFQSLGKLN